MEAEEHFGNLKRHSNDSGIPVSLDRRLLRYTLAAGASLTATAASRAQVLFTPNNSILKMPAKLVIDMDHDGVGDFLLVVKPTFSFSGYQIVGGARAYALKRYSGIGVNRNGAAAIKRKELIDGMGAFSSVATMATGWGYIGNWYNIKNGFLAVRLDVNGEFHFGWIGFRSFNNKKTILMTLAGWAYETQPDKGIRAGDTGTNTDVEVDSIQPTSLEMLATGHAATQNWRQRKQN